MSIKLCENCGEECYRDEVDIGVGIIYGPYGCYSCGWSENSKYDRSKNGTSPAQIENPDYYVDPCGGMIKKSAIEESLNRLKLDGRLIVKEVFD